RGGTIENTDIVEPQKAALENIHTFRIFAVYPPGEIEQQLLKDLCQEGSIRSAADSSLDLVNSPGRPRVNRRVDVTERPLVGRQLTVRMHVPFAKKET